MANPQQEENDRIGAMVGMGAGAAAGASLGSVLIPVPMLGTFLGGLLGGVLGSEVGKTFGGGLLSLINLPDGGLTPPPASPPTKDLAEQLERLSQLHASGALSDAEFAAAKARLLGL